MVIESFENLIKKMISGIRGIISGTSRNYKKDILKADMFYNNSGARVSVKYVVFYLMLKSYSNSQEQFE